MIKANKYPIQSSEVVFREESDDWAILFDPNSGETYGLDPVSIFVWKRLDGKHSVEEIVNELEKECIDGIPESAPQEITDFIHQLTSKGFASC